MHLIWHANFIQNKFYIFRQTTIQQPPKISYKLPPIYQSLTHNMTTPITIDVFHLHPSTYISRARKFPTLE